MTREKLRDIFQSPFSYKNWQSILMSLFSGAGKNCQLTLENTPVQMPVADEEKMDGFYIGEVRFGMESVKLYTFLVKDNTTNISRNRVGLRSTVNYLRDYVDAAIVIYYNDNEWRASYIYDEITNPKRFTYSFGNGTSLYRTAVERFGKLSDADISTEKILDAFSVEALSSDFFKGYKERYIKFKGTFEGKEQKWHRDFVKKMMGRLVFLQFLQKKGWLNGDYNYLQNLYTTCENKGDFLEHILEPLFFGVLNTKPEDREQLFNKNGWSLSLLEQWSSIPYLNGGLFEEDVLDKKRVVFPAALFENLFEFFSHYNFTIDENDPNDAEVGIDPEMLGHIFENLLEDNKDKGAFYTPKEIVQYMCRESLVQYLKSRTDSALHHSIEQLVTRHTVTEQLQNSKAAAELTSLLVEVKICDPAIGSGAFPMGILNEVFALRKLLFGHTVGSEKFLPAQIKKEIIQNNIYGVDIEQGAVDIARLRFWLSLVVDESEPQPLPNLDYKIMCGNSLLSRYELNMPFDDVFKEYNRGKSDADKMSLDRYRRLVADYTNTSDHTQKADFRKTIEEIKSAFRTELSKGERNKASKLKGQIYTLEAPMLFGERTKQEKDELKKLKAQLVQLEKEQADIANNKLYEDAFEWRFEFPQLLDDDGNFVGFDIVIGNPPYLRIQGIRDTNPTFAEELVKKYKSATGSFDLYAAFAERGLQIINRGGVVNYIMPIKWTNAAFGKGLRGVVAENSSACKIINFGAYQVFNASTYTGLQWFKPDSSEMLYYELDRNLETNQELGRYLDSLNPSNGAKINADKLNKDAWVLTVGQTTEILHKLEQHPRRISDIFDKIFQGLATSKDDVYFLYGCVEYDTTIKGYSKHLNRIIEIERGLVKPLLKGEDVHRYDNISTDRFVVFPYILGDGKANLYAEKQLSELFPLGYSYLKECEEVLRGREKGRFDIDGEWFQFGRKQGILSAETEKLVAPDISLGGNFAYDVKGEFYQTTTIYGYIKKPHVKDSYKVLMALLNSRLCWWFLTNTGTTLANGYFRFKPDYINPFPVPKEISKTTEETIVTVVDKILEAKKANPTADTTALESQIDQMVYALYNLTPEEIRTIDHKTPITQQ